MSDKEIENVLNIISLLGLVLDIIGVYLLFVLKDVYFKKLSANLRLSSQEKRIYSRQEDMIGKSVHKLMESINEMFDKVAIENSIINKKAKKSMVLILLGFGLQLLVYLYRIFY